MTGAPRASETARGSAPRARLAAWLPEALVLALSLTGPARARPADTSPHGDLTIACGECHSTADWQPLRRPLPFDHSTTGFGLDGMHGTLPCLTCHQDLVLADVASACADCHLDPHDGALGFACDDCHGTLSRDPRFGLTEFHDTTEFPLTGAHRALECGACHPGTPPFDYQLTPVECLGCHREQELAAEPDHVAAAFGSDCQGCHRTDSWIPADIVLADLDHDGFFPLRGAHRPLDCGACHQEGSAVAPAECAGCHEADFLAARDPDHAALGLSTDCEGCHGSDTWSGATAVDHDAFFVLRGVHAVLDCAACHAESYGGTPSDCAPCHEPDYAAAADPDHAALGLDLACEACHGESTWHVTALDHDPFLPLVGAHAGLACESCHETGFDGTSPACFACHAAEYSASRNPDHRLAGFDLECEACHGSRRWSDGTFDHSFFPHQGGHRGLECTDCHSDVYEGNDRACVACHLADYRSAEPDHEEAGFPTACELCHDIFGWHGAPFDHSSFPLREGHAGLDCFDCHRPDGFDGAPSDCFACHQDDYDGASDPDHRAAGFPIFCEECHKLRDWQETSFEHDSQYFPIYSGSHADVWDTCATCHLDPRDFGFFECLLCHEHNQRHTDADHQNVEGYKYVSEACLRCHAIFPG